MIEKMKYITITGPLDSVDWVIEQHLSRQEIHLEYTIQQHKDLSGLRAVDNDNPYQDLAEKSKFFMEFLQNTAYVYFPTSGKAAAAVVEDAYHRYQLSSLHFKSLEEERDLIQAYIDSILPYSNLPLWDLANAKNICCIFGNMPLQNFLQFQNFVYDDTLTIFLESQRDKEKVWGCFLTPVGEEIENILASYHFEQADITAKQEDIPFLKSRLLEIELQIHKATLAEIPDKNALLAACLTIQNLHRVFAIKQYAAKTARHYIFVGWMPQSAAKRFQKYVANDDRVIVTPSENPAMSTPPTKLINLPIIRYFEFFVRLYGIPKYNETDPTAMLAILYTLLFGMMFGDVGHGFGLALLGWYLKPKHELGGVMISAGLSAVFFGFLYGSIFGLEDVIPSIWQKPMQDITGTLMIAVALGALVILLSMAFNMFNALQQKDYKKLLFSPNGLAGMLGYIMIIAAAFGFIHWMAVILPFIPVVIWGMAQQEKSNIGMTIFQRALGLFEILLAYLTNTISFVRVGAFALSHAGMMHVVMMLSQGSAESRNFVVFILGNVIVMGIEGLLIGIQSLRLGLYEIFSRFYEGGGRNFEKT